MKLYLAGPMRMHGPEGLYNFPAFFKAASAIRKLGHEVVNPAEMDMARGFDPSLALDDPDQIDFCIEETLRADFKQILDCDGIVLLCGWEKSSGARDEHHVCRRTGRLIFYYNPVHGVLVPVGNPLDSEVKLSGDVETPPVDRLWENLPGVKSIRLTLRDVHPDGSQVLVRVDVVDSETGEQLYDFGDMPLERSNQCVEIKLDAEVELTPEGEAA